MIDRLLFSTTYVLPSVLLGFLISYFLIFLIKKITKASSPKINYFIGFLITWVICTVIQVVSLYNMFPGSILLIPIVISLLILYILYLSKKANRVNH